MNRATLAEVVRRRVDQAPPLNPRQRLQLAVLLRPDLPVGIARTPSGSCPTNGTEDR